MEKIWRNDEAPAGNDVTTTEEPNSTGVSGVAAKAVETALQKASAVEGQSNSHAESLIDTTNHAERSAKQISEKVTQYLLNTENKDGKSKADWFNGALGINRQNSEVLSRQLIFDEGKAVKSKETIYGNRYKQVIEIVGTNGRTLPITVVWQRDIGDGFIRFVTAMPGGR